MLGFRDCRIDRSGRDGAAGGPWGRGLGLQVRGVGLLQLLEFGNDDELAVGVPGVAVVEALVGGVGGIEVNESWVREDIWTKEPTLETVERLIEWFSDKRN